MSDASRKPLTTERIGTEDLLVRVPAIAPDPVDTVIVLKTDGPVKGRLGRLLQAQSVPNRLLGFDAIATGKGFVYGDGKTARYYVDGLEKAGNLLTWNVRTDRAQRFSVELKYSTPKPTWTTASKFVVMIGKTRLTAPIEATPSAREMRTVRMGEINIEPGKLQDMTVTVEGGGDPVHFFEIDLKAL